MKPTSTVASLLRVAMLAVAILSHSALCAQVRQRGTLNASSLSSGTMNTSANTTGFNNATGNPFGDNDSSSRDTNAVRGLVYNKETPDTVLQKQVFMFRYTPFRAKINEVWNPDLSPTGLQFVDPKDALNGNYYLGKGTVGQPHVAIFPTMAAGIVDHLQPDPNIAYAKRPENIWLYQTMTPFTTLGYQSSLEKDYQVRVAHTQNIKPGWNIAFDYNLIRPEGDYTSSGAKNHYLDATTNYFSADSRLQATAGIIWQSFNIDENGGIADDSYFTERLQSNRAGVPVNLYNSGTRHRETSAFVRATYNLVQQVDSYKYRDSIAIRTISDTITVVDTVKLTDTIHPAQQHVLNAGVVGIELRYDRRKRVFADSTLWIDRSMSVFWTNDAYPDYRWRNPLKVTLGLNPRNIKAVVDDRPEIKIIQYIAPFADVDVALGRCTLKNSASFGDPYGEAEYHLGSTLEIRFDSAGRHLLQISAATQRENPGVRYISDASYNQGLELRMINSQRYEVQFYSGHWLDIMVRASHQSHNVWSDTSLTVHEGSTGLWLYQAALTTRMKAGWFHLDMQQLLQHSTDQEQMPVPLLASKNSMYAEFVLFNKALTLQTGIDLRYHTAFYSPTYDYRTGLFVHQDEYKVGNYLWGDVFVSIQVRRASIYIKAGHVNAVWETSPNYLILPHYPGHGFGLYWGINWKFFD